MAEHLPEGVTIQMLADMKMNGADLAAHLREELIHLTYAQRVAIVGKVQALRDTQVLGNNASIIIPINEFAALGLDGTPTKAKEQLIANQQRFNNWTIKGVSPQTKHSRGYTKVQSWTNLPGEYKHMWVESLVLYEPPSVGRLLEGVLRSYSSDLTSVNCSAIVTSVLDYSGCGLEFDSKTLHESKIPVTGRWNGRFPGESSEDIDVAEANAALCWLLSQQCHLFDSDLSLLEEGADEVRIFHPSTGLLLKSLLLFEPYDGYRLAIFPEDHTQKAPREDFRVFIAKVAKNGKVREVERKSVMLENKHLEPTDLLSRLEVKPYSLMKKGNLHTGLGELVNYSKDYNKPDHFTILTDFWTVIGMWGHSANALDYSFSVTPRMEIGLQRDVKMPILTSAGYFYLSRYAFALKRLGNLPRSRISFEDWTVLSLLAETENSVVLSVDKEGKEAVLKIPRVDDASFRNEIQVHSELDNFGLKMSKLVLEGAFKHALGTVPYIVLFPRGNDLTRTDAQLLLEEGPPILEALHSRGYVHGDVKPSNFFKVGEVLYISDLGTCGKVSSYRLGSTPEYGYKISDTLQVVDDWRSLYISYMYLIGTPNRKEEPASDKIALLELWDKCQFN